MTTNLNEMARLRTGKEVPAAAARTTLPALELLAKGDITDAVALYEARKLAADPAHAMWTGAPERLTALGLLTPDGKMHDIVRDIILAAVEEGDNPRVTWPFEAPEPDES